VVLHVPRRRLWCEQAERSGIAALNPFAQRLKGSVTSTVV